MSTVICHILNNQQTYNKINSNQNPWFSLDNFRVNYKSTTNFKLTTVNEDVINVGVGYLNNNTFSLEVTINGEKTIFEAVSGKHVGDREVEIKIHNDSIFKVQVQF